MVNNIVNAIYTPCLVCCHCQTKLLTQMEHTKLRGNGYEGIYHRDALERYMQEFPLPASQISLVIHMNFGACTCWRITMVTRTCNVLSSSLDTTSASWDILVPFSVASP